MQPRPEPIVEKLRNGGTSFFFPADVLSFDQLDKCVVVILKDGRRIELIDDVQHLCIAGTSTVVPQNTLFRLQQRIHPPAPPTAP